MAYLLVPGRHLVNTRFQEAYLFQHVRPPVSHIVVAITSCNQSHSRYNPIPFHIRAIAVDRFMRGLAVALGVRYSIIGIPHHRPTPRFAEIVIKEVAEQSGGAIDLAPSRTQVVCSTPQLIERYRALGYEVLTAEAVETAPGQWSFVEALPIEVVQRLGQRVGQRVGPRDGAAGADALDDSWIRQRIHPASFSTLRDFPEVVHAIQALYDEPLLGDEGSLTETRDYDSYVRAMAGAIDLKYADIRDALVPGRIIDEGCADGALLARIARDFPDSDLIGVDLSAEMLARAAERRRAGDFSGCFAFFRQHNLMKPLPLRSPVDTVICNSTLHELYSYAGGADAVRRYLRMKHAQLRMGGRLVARDVVGPSQRTRTVLLWCNPDDGVADHTTATPTAEDTPATLEARLCRLSSAARFRRFALDFLPGPRPGRDGHGRRAGVRLGGSHDPARSGLSTRAAARDGADHQDELHRQLAVRDARAVLLLGHRRVAGRARSGRLPRARGHARVRQRVAGGAPLHRPRGAVRSRRRPAAVPGDQHGARRREAVAARGAIPP
jgi:SAM-dependent methyltransferase